MLQKVDCKPKGLYIWGPQGSLMYNGKVRKSLLGLFTIPTEKITHHFAIKLLNSWIRGNKWEKFSSTYI